MKTQDLKQMLGHARDTDGEEEMYILTICGDCPDCKCKPENMDSGGFLYFTPTRWEFYWECERNSKHDFVLMDTFEHTTIFGGFKRLLNIHNKGKVGHLTIQFPNKKKVRFSATSYTHFQNECDKRVAVAKEVKKSKLHVVPKVKLPIL